jgi:hypothetical protein
MLQMFIFVCVISCAAKAQTYSWDSWPTDCNCTSATLGTLTSADFDQSQASQDAAWTSFKNYFPGIVDSDRLGNRTKTYNCHSWIYTSYSKWLNSGELSKYKGTSPGCWEADASGSMKSNSTHSCTSSNTGKCGQLFLCKNNQHVYGASMPTQKYKKN